MPSKLEYYMMMPYDIQLHDIINKVGLGTRLSRRAMLCTDSAQPHAPVLLMAPPMASRAPLALFPLFPRAPVRSILRAPASDKMIYFPESCKLVLILD